jgi:hypothetical protein
VWDDAFQSERGGSDSIEWMRRCVEAVRAVVPDASPENIAAAREFAGRATVDAEALLEYVLDRCYPVDRTLQ